MSKSKGNVIPLVDIARKYSADLLRMYIFSSSDIDSVVDWRENEVLSVKNKLTSFANTVVTASKAVPATKFENIDKWIRSRFYSRLKKAYEQGSGMKIRNYSINIFFEFINELNYYKKRVSINQFNSVLRSFLSDWLIALEPIIPHICEEIWSKMNKGFVSLQLFPKIKSIDYSIEQSQQVVINTISDVNEVIKLVKKKPKKITLFIADEWKYTLYEIIVKAKDKHDFKALINAAMKKPSLKSNGKEVTKIIQNLIKNPTKIPISIASREDEYQSLNESIKFLEKEYNTEIDVVKATNPKAMPSKPGILIE